MSFKLPSIPPPPGEPDPDPLDALIEQMENDPNLGERMDKALAMTEDQWRMYQQAMLELEHKVKAQNQMPRRN